ncbi:MULTISPECIES: VOC family protein [unclassified Novosphingobium]|uniref:VOC family protein n=1 Tax=unclassified Novosphingobium TaxID=2644732 RepID=UPI00061C4E03|nr:MULTISPECIES: VOC family protein [unclassified Novosphingobium]GAO53669.1 glyoxalase family protein [Novosphingobium sp. MD-1]
MQPARLEHVNITVSDPERMASFLSRLCGWEERWRGPSQLGGWTIHVGSADTDYLALWTPDEKRPMRFAKSLPLNHVGLLVDDLDAAERTVIEAGLVPFNHADYEPGRRFYFFDWDGIEFEVVSYT